MLNIRPARRATQLNSGGDDENSCGDDEKQNMKISDEYEFFVSSESHSDCLSEKTHEKASHQDFFRQSFLSPNLTADYTNIKKECKEKIASLISLKSRPGSPSVSPWSNSSDTSVFTFPESDDSAILSPLLQRKAPSVRRPISPLVTSDFNQGGNVKHQYSRSSGKTLTLALRGADMKYM